MELGAGEITQFTGNRKALYKGEMRPMLSSSPKVLQKGDITASGWWGGSPAVTTIYSTNAVRELSVYSTVHMYSR
jgi:hypothetical protein